MPENAVEIVPVFPEIEKYFPKTAQKMAPQKWSHLS
jgi:hypothetical protein